ncbi:MAG: NAD(P)/FAD-dependent oxidoreductase [Clostridia bacterium]|nr:NAD(P)/FAD-dependent oxidoreductase [Clostridia bacterium]
MYNRLFSTGRIGKLDIPNRIVMPAMGVNLGSPLGGVTDDLIAYYEARARGGCGLIITEVTRIEDGCGISDPCQMAARGAGDVADLQRLTDAIHKYDTRVFIQLQHPGANHNSAITGLQAVAASPVNPMGGPVPRQLTQRECEEYVQKFVTGAFISQLAGADGVELHGAHGYLINSFLSPALNLRTDNYGGCFEKRMLFVSQIIAGIKDKCGKDFPVSVRINAEEAIAGGTDSAQAARIAKALQDAGADAINASCYSDGCIEPGTYRQGWKRHMAQAVKNAVSIPVISVCNVKEPAVAEELLEGGVCDFVGVGRGQLADPEWCDKAFSSREDEIRKCIGCLACFGEIVKLRRVKCGVNPVTGREREYANIRRDGAGRAAAVIGAGPAGMEAALVLAQRGFRVTLFDEAQRPGGTLNVADRGYGKEKITRYTDSLITQVKKAGVALRLGEKATIEAVKRLNPCGVFVAVGAEPLIPPIPGMDRRNVVTAESVLLGRAKPSGDVAVTGSGMTGLETAEMLAAAGCRLTLIEMLDELGPGMYPSVVTDVMSRILPSNPRILTGHRLDRVTPNGVEITRLADGESLRVPADTVVLALGVRPRKDLADSFKEAFANVRVVGDALKGGRILEATQDAHAKAFEFEP